jgi:FAD/FMN-containing dehydrogenase
MQTHADTATNRPAIDAPETPAPQRHSWGHYPVVQHSRVEQLDWRRPHVDFAAHEGSYLAYGLGRSYGDSCLNDGGALIETPSNDNFLEFNEQTGVLRCQAGVTLAQIIDFALPRGWFLPTSPGTKFVTVGGAIANDVHGKNHHVAGTFGRHVLSFELLRSDGERLTCSQTQNRDLYRATIAGLGLTGLIVSAEVQLRRAPGPFIAMESIRFSSLDEFIELSHDADQRFEYTMSWVDCMATGKSAGRGIFLGGNHAWQRHIPGQKLERPQRLAVPFEMPLTLLNNLSVRAFNELWYRKQLAKSVSATQHYDPFFYPLDSVGDWNRIYGRRGFLQHQCVIPHEYARTALLGILEAVARSGQGSFLAVLKTFGDVPSPGMLSFPRPGLTLALDFAVRGQSTFDLLDALDEIVLANHGAVYPAKDARMAPGTFEASFPNWREFSPYVDQRFSSSFWRRVTGPLKASDSTKTTRSI